MLDQIVRNARLPGRSDLVDIGFEGGRIAALENHIASDAPAYDAGGCLCCGGLVETHIHLDKSRIVDRCAPAEGRVDDAIQRVSSIKHTFTVEDVYERAKATLERSIANGTTRMRTHAEVDPKVGLRGVEAVLALAKDYAWAIGVEVCVLPQEGLTNNPGTDELLMAAMRQGCRVIGAAPGFDSDPPAQMRRVFEIAREFDADVDMHLDFGTSHDQLDAGLLCELTDQHGWGGRVTFGHGTKFSTMPPEQQATWARRLADSGVSLTVLPATDLFLMGRNRSYDVIRGVVDASLFVHNGCNCSISTNNVLNPFTPFGDCSLLRIANLHANIQQIANAEAIGECFSMITDRSARLLNLPDYGIAVGNAADVTVIDAESPAQAVAEIGQPLAVFKGGRRTVTRTRPELHPPFKNT